MEYLFQEPFELEGNAHRVRSFTICQIPVVLQTLAYREYLLKRIGLSDDDFRLAMSMTLKRQELLWEEQRRWHFIICENALYTHTGNDILQLALLDRLRQFMELYNMKIGIIPLEAGLVSLDVSTFNIYDETCVSKSIANEDIQSNSNKDIVEHSKLFDELDKLAEYGNLATVLLRKASAYFSQ
jgi:hypothetical protein